MGIAIQKQLDLRPYSDKNLVTKPAVETPATQAPADEEKSNAAKWMIGLTATAAIAIGGLYAAKHGKLGEGAEKWAKKLFGEAVNEAKPTPKSTTGAPEAHSNPVPTVMTLAPLVFARKSISKLIKKPNKSLTEIMTEFQQAGVKLEQKGDNLLEIRTGKKPEDITKLLFKPDGTLASIQRATKKAASEIFTFDNQILTKIERKIPTPSGKPLEHLVEFAQDGAVKAKRFVLNDGLKELPLNSQFLKRVKLSEIVEAYIPRTSKYFKQAVKELEIVRVTATKFGDESSINVNKILRQFSDAHTSPKEAEFLEKNLCTPEKVTVIIQEMAGKNNAFGAEVLKLIQKDIKEMKSISIDTIKAMAKDYAIKLRANKITKPEHVSIVGKPIQECSYDEMLEILREVAPDKVGNLGIVQDPFKDKAQEAKAILHTIKILTGRSNISERTTLLEILQDL